MCFSGAIMIVIGTLFCCEYRDLQIATEFWQETSPKLHIYICHNTISCLYMTEHLNSYYNVCALCFVFCSVVHTFISRILLYTVLLGMSKTTV